MVARSYVFSVAPSSLAPLFALRASVVGPPRNACFELGEVRAHDECASPRLLPTVERMIAALSGGIGFKACCANRICLCVYFPVVVHVGKMPLAVIAKSGAASCFELWALTARKMLKQMWHVTGGVR